ncbi:MAG TPA: hypothetical protein VGI90_14515 [Steroidobacteraceae bacterium]|jgi:hypothetical protein
MDKLTTAEEERLLAFFDKINQTTWPDGSIESRLRYIDELAAIVLADSGLNPRAHRFAKKCMELVPKARALDPKSLLDLGGKFQFLLTLLGPDAVAVEKYHGSQSDPGAGSRKRHADEKADIDYRNKRILDSARDRIRKLRELPDPEQRAHIVAQLIEEFKGQFGTGKSGDDKTGRSTIDKLVTQALKQFKPKKHSRP